MVYASVDKFACSSGVFDFGWDARLGQAKHVLYGTRRAQTGRLRSFGGLLGRQQLQLNSPVAGRKHHLDNIPTTSKMDMQIH